MYNIQSLPFLQVESSVVLKPFLMKLTRSELHAVMTSGFATVAGTVIAAYVEFGVSNKFTYLCEIDTTKSNQ